MYEDITGQKTNGLDTYDFVVTVDERHQNSKYSSYLWIDSDGTIMEIPILLSKDKVQLGVRKGFMNFGFDPLLNLPINGSQPISSEYQKLFNSAF